MKPKTLFLGCVLVGLAASGAWAEVAAPAGTTPEAVLETAPPRSVLQPGCTEETVETLLDAKVYAHGGYGGLGAKVTTLDGRTECLTGARFGYIMNHQINIGFAGYGLATDQYKKTINGIERRLGMGYGGLDVGYTFAPNSLVHITLQTLVGAGGIGYEYTTNRWHKDSDNQGHWESDIEGDAFFVAEPMLLIELNVTKWFRLAVGGGYRYVDGVDENIVGVSSTALRGANGEVALRFGFF